MKKANSNKKKRKTARKSKISKASKNKNSASRENPIKKSPAISKKTRNSNPYIPKPYKVIDYHKETPDNFTLTVDMKIKHDPGQFVQVSIPGIGECPISICSDSDEYIQLNIREVGNVTRALSKLRKGDVILIRGPYGRGYPMQYLNGNDVVVIGGGCGVAPLKSVIDYIENHRADYRNVLLILGYRSDEDIIFKREIAEWDKKYKVHMTLDKEVHSHICYDMRAGFVTDAMNSLHLSKDNKIVFVCGPPVMIRNVIANLKEKGFNYDQIFISAERLMYCAIGICCHCMIRGKYTCVDGPVFRYDEIKELKTD